MFARARRRLTLTYLLMFALVFGLFSLVFYVGLSVVLEPEFDVDPAATTTASEQAAYRAAVDRIGTALLVADGVAIAAVGAGAWLLADRTLRPIREAHERQRRFVADASHELRTPVAVIRSTIEGRLTRPSSADNIDAALATVVDAADRLTRVTNDLLLLARTEDRTLEPRREPFDLSVAVAEAIETESAARGGRTPEARLTADLVVEADATDISIIVRNLLDNAFVHGGSGVTVRVSTSGSDSEATVEVSDDGPGIAASERARVFEPFFRGQRDATAPSGSGLGLAIAADLARRNDGRLFVEPVRPHGATFRLVLPRFR